MQVLAPERYTLDTPSNDRDRATRTPISRTTLPTVTIYTPQSAAGSEERSPVAFNLNQYAKIEGVPNDRADLLLHQLHELCFEIDDIQKFSDSSCGHRPTTSVLYIKPRGGPKELERLRKLGTLRVHFEFTGVYKDVVIVNEVGHSLPCVDSNVSDIYRWVKIWWYYIGTVFRRLLSFGGLF